MVCYIWWEHNQFFRRYGLQDAWTAFLNSILLFVVLFYVYPLKFLATVLLSPLVGGAGMPRDWDARFVMLTYSVGVTLIFGTFVLLYQHAWRRRASLDLDPEDLVTLRFKKRAHLISTCLGLTSIALAAVVSEQWHVDSRRAVRTDGSAARRERLAGWARAGRPGPRAGGGLSRVRECLTGSVVWYNSSASRLGRVLP